MTRLPLMLCLLAIGCGKKDSTSTAAPAQAAAEKPDTPADAKSEKFGETLVGLSITDFRPLNAGSGKFVYNTLGFEADNTWRGEGYIEIAGETLECIESGTWSMEPAESATVAVMTWSVAETDCINQEPGDRRYRVTISGSDISVEYR